MDCKRRGGKYSSFYQRALLERVRIEEVIGGLVKLERVNEDYAYGICPFHQEQTPSFTVSERQQFFHCFGCGMYGNVFDFLERYYSLFTKERRVAQRLEKRKGWHFLFENQRILARYERVFLARQKPVTRLDVIRYLAQRYNYWPRHFRKDKRSEKS